MEEYRKAVCDFNEVFQRLRKKYGLMQHVKEKNYGESFIKIWQERSGEKRLILSVSEEDIVLCYRKAADELLWWQRMLESA